MFGLQIIPAKLFVCSGLEQILLLKGEQHYQVVMLDDHHQKLPQISLPGGNGSYFYGVLKVIHCICAIYLLTNIFITKLEATDFKLLQN